MTSNQNIDYALGILAYSIAKADGNIQKEERESFHKIISVKNTNSGFGSDYSEIIFHILEKDKTDAGTAYRWAIDEIKKIDYFFTKELKNKFIQVINKIAEAFPPVTTEEKRFVEQANKDIRGLNSEELAF